MRYLARLAAHTMHLSPKRRALSSLHRYLPLVRAAFAALAETLPAPCWTAESASLVIEQATPDGAPIVAMAQGDVGEVCQVWLQVAEASIKDRYSRETTVTLQMGRYVPLTSRKAVTTWNQAC